MTMTNNPTIDVVSRELLELAVEYLKIHGERSSIEYSTAEDLQTLLDANPRILSGEPVGVLLIDEYFDNREVGDVDVQLDSETCERLAKDLPGQSLQLYIATPEVAALQSTIERQAAVLSEASAWIKANSCHGTDAIDLWERIDATAALNAPKPTEWYDVAGDDEGVSL